MTIITNGSLAIMDKDIDGIDNAFSHSTESVPCVTASVLEVIFDIFRRKKRLFSSSEGTATL